jgi:ADP-ribosylglycohydrolase
MLRAALLGAPSADVWQVTHERLPELHAELAEVFAGSYQHRQPPVIQGSGYAVKSLEAALWAVYQHQDDYRSAILAAANLGRDADTTAAIAGQLAGALVGESGIPLAWREHLYRHDLLAWYAEELLRMHEQAGDSSVAH